MSTKTDPTFSSSAAAPIARDDWEKRLAHTEAEMNRLGDTLQTLRADWEQHREKGARQAGDYETLREAVLRYAVACGAVDVQVAMLRARGETSQEAVANLQQSTEEQTEASNALRALARTLQG